MKSLPFAIAVALIPCAANAASALPKDNSIKVAIVLSEGATVIDFAGPWEVFQDTMLYTEDGGMIMPFELYTVAPSTTPVHTSGAGRHGMTVTPDYNFADAPEPDIVVIGAQAGGEGLSEWLQKMHGDKKLVMSVCTGAFKLAKAGLLDGKEATTHHWYFGNFEQQFPNVKLVHQVRYVQADPLTFTAGGLTSGVDLALHVVAARFGDDVAQHTADYMEYTGTAWKTRELAAEFPTPVTRHEWSGKLPSGSSLTVHQVTYGASPKFSADFPALKASSVPATFQVLNGNVMLAFDIPGHHATFLGKPNADETAMAGTFTQDGKEQPLTLTVRSPKSQ
ncbi:MAG: DJ-1/PfpI family protein [Rudaea sp.]|nr:DJ-1/PfpI family protein [Rudaea sp.]